MPNENIEQAIKQLEAAIQFVNAEISDDLKLGAFEEFLSGNELRLNNPCILAQLLMENLSDPMADCDRFTQEEKVFWAQAVDHMGPDWISKFRRVGAFMAKVDEA